MRNSLFNKHLLLFLLALSSASVLGWVAFLEHKQGHGSLLRSLALISVGICIPYIAAAVWAVFTPLKINERKQDVVAAPRTANGHRLVTALDLICEATLPLFFFVAWWWPDQSISNDSNGLLLVLCGEAALAVAMLLTTAIQLDLNGRGALKPLSSTTPALLVFAVPGIWVGGFFFALAVDALMNFKLSVLVVTAAMLVRLVGIFGRSGNATSFPANSKQAALALTILFLLWMSLLYAQSTELFPNDGSGAKGFLLVGSLYFGLIFGVRLWRTVIGSELRASR